MFLPALLRALPLPAPRHPLPLPAPCLKAYSIFPNSRVLGQCNRFLAYPLEYSSRISLCRMAMSTRATADMEEAKEENQFVKLKQKMVAVGIDSDSCTPGQFDLLYCPKCKGGQSIHRSLSFHIDLNWSYAVWRCFHLQCGWAGKVFVDTRKASSVNIHDKMNIGRSPTMESLRLEMLGDELVTYFAERKISKGTLLRNNVMQVAGGQKIIAFTYQRDGQFAGCKYRTLEKRYWQEKNTEKLFYGLDDIAEADEIIIVEGELDKLSVEEAGYRNCVSVPNGAPQTVSLEVPSLEKDTRFQYLRNCKHYLDKASRIILATDSDSPGRALAEELARRLGRERCWQVQWPKKDESQFYKDANEVLMCLGADVVRDAIGNAELYK